MEVILGVDYTEIHSFKTSFLLSDGCGGGRFENLIEQQVLLFGTKTMRVSCDPSKCS